MAQSRYSFLRALRPFSFSVALVICLTGLTLAWQDGHQSPLLLVLTLAAGLLLQAGVNLINDYTDLPLLTSPEDKPDRSLIRQNFRYGLSAFLLAAVIAFYLISQSGIALLWLSLLGLLGALGYTQEPVNYKRRGLGVVLVFLFMGVFMVEGSYFVLAGEFSWRVLWLSLPVSLLTSLLLLSNEIRDYESDGRDASRTLSVRIGMPAAITLYRTGLVLTPVLALLLTLSGLLPYAWITLLVLPLLLKFWKMPEQPVAERKSLPPWTGRYFLLFGVLYNSAILMG